VTPPDHGRGNEPSPRTHETRTHETKSHAHESGGGRASKAGGGQSQGGHSHGHGTSPAPAHRPVAAISDIVAAARRALSPTVWDSIVGGAETETTLRRNRAALDALAVRGRVLSDVSVVDPGGSLLGAPMRIPVVLAPIGSLRQVTPTGTVASIAAAGAFGTLVFAAGGSIDARRDLAGAGAGARTVYQVYGRGDRAWLLEQADLAAEAGCIGICLTADVPWFGRRERDLRRAELPAGPYARSAAGHPVTWADVDALAGHGRLPVVLKGILSAEDAVAAVDRGVAAVYVSNHGGRQLDHAEASVTVLTEVVDAIGGRAQVVVDGGFLRGTDVVKALALGADAVAIGKLQAVALAAAGEEGLVNTLEILEDEVRTTMSLMGVASRRELARDQVRPAPAVTGHPHPLEAMA